MIRFIELVLVLALVATPVAIYRIGGWRLLALLTFRLVCFVVKWSAVVLLAVHALVVGAAARRGLAFRGAAAWFRADLDWRRIAVAHELVGGRVIGVRPTAVGRILTILLPRGATIESLKTSTAASATGTSAAVLRSGRIPRIVRIALRTGTDPLATPVEPADLVELPDLTRLEIGVTEDGTPWCVKLLGEHILIGGVTGSGKGSVLWGIGRAVAPAVKAGLVELHGVDPKGGMELGMGRAMFANLATRQGAMLALLEAAVKEMDERAERLAGVTRLHTPTVEEPLRVVVIDEVATLTAYHPDIRIRQAFQSQINMLLSKGRAVGVSVILALQDPRKEILPMRALVPVKIALRLDEAAQVPMVLGDSARARGAEADWIDPALPGVGYVMVDGTRDPIRVRAAHIDDKELARICLAYGRARADADAEGVNASAPAPAPAREGGPRFSSSKRGGRSETKAERRSRNRAEWPGHRRGGS